MTAPHTKYWHSGLAVQRLEQVSHVIAGSLPCVSVCGSKELASHHFFVQRTTAAGAAVARAAGDAVAAGDGGRVGTSVGVRVGSSLGMAVVGATAVGASDGGLVGRLLGATVGAPVGSLHEPAA